MLCDRHSVQSPRGNFFQFTSEHIVSSHTQSSSDQLHLQQIDVINWIKKHFSNSANQIQLQSYEGKGPRSPYKYQIWQSSSVLRRISLSMGNQQNRSKGESTKITKLRIQAVGYRRWTKMSQNLYSNFAVMLSPGGALSLPDVLLLIFQNRQRFLMRRPQYRNIVRLRWPIPRLISWL